MQQSLEAAGTKFWIQTNNSTWIKTSNINHSRIATSNVTAMVAIHNLSAYSIHTAGRTPEELCPCQTLLGVDSRAARRKDAPQHLGLNPAGVLWEGGERKDGDGKQTRGRGEAHSSVAGARQLIRRSEEGAQEGEIQPPNPKGSIYSFISKIMRKPPS